MSESCIRFERKDGFTILYNSLVRDPRLSLKTKGLMAVIVSLPETWNYNVGGLATVAGVGKDAIRSALNELESAGYLTREQSHNPAGKFAGNIYVIHEQGICTPLSGYPTTVEPTTGKPLTENPTLVKKDIYKKEIDTPLKPPKGGGRQKELSGEVRALLNEYVGHDRELAEELGLLMDVRTEKRAVNSVKAIEALLKELDKLSDGDRETKLQLLKQSALNSWKSVFPLKGSRGSYPQREEGERVVV